MGARTREGPVERGDAPTGPAKLSVADRGLITPNVGDPQPAEPRCGSGEAKILLTVEPDPGRPGWFTASVAGDDRLLARSRTPFLDAARELLGSGVDPATVLVMRHAGSTTESLRAAVGVAATLTVEESAHGPVFRRHRTTPPSAVGGASVRSDDQVGMRDPVRDAVRL